MSESVVIVGPGRMGLALGAALRKAGAVDRLLFFGRSLEAPPHPLFEAGEDGAEYRMGPVPLPGGTTVVILAVPDTALGELGQQLAMAGEAPAGCVALHLSGALSTDVLAPLHAVGYAVGSLHPLQTIADPWSAGDRLFGCGYAVAGEPAALAAAHRLVSALAGTPLVIPPAMRPLYHAAAVFVANYVVTAAAVAVRALGRAGVAEDDAVRSLVPLMRGTLDNLEQLGLTAALTGPIARGDADTVRLHLAALSPEGRRLYSALGLETVRLARAAGLDQERAGELERLLSD